MRIGGVREHYLSALGTSLIGLLIREMKTIGAGYRIGIRDAEVPHTLAGDFMTGGISHSYAVPDPRTYA
jgi:hypothetical protein